VFLSRVSTVLFLIVEAIIDRKNTVFKTAESTDVMIRSINIASSSANNYGIVNPKNILFLLSQ
jgi:hypothetical protein